MSDTGNMPGGMDHALDPRDQYLWDRSGPVDVAVALLERAAEPLRFKPVARLDAARARVLTRSVWTRGLAIAAVLALGAMVLFMAWPGRPPGPAPQTWTIAKATGATVGEPRTLKAATGSTTQRVTTAPAGSLILEAPGGTRVEIGGSASVTIVEAGPQWPWIDVHQGTAKVTVGEAARPVSLGVLGEKLTFAPRSAGTVDISGKGTARVAITGGTAEALVGKTTTRFAPGTTADMQPDGAMAAPVREGADPAFVASVRKLEGSLGKGEMKSMSFLADQLMSRAKPADAPTVWNLMVRASPEGRRVLRDVLAKLVKAPPQPAFDDVLKLDPQALDAWWKAALDAR